MGGISSVENQFQYAAMLGSLILAISLGCNGYFVWCNIQLHRATDEKAIRLQQMEATRREWQSFLQELGAYAQRDPELETILRNHGLKIAAPAQPSAPMP